MNYYPDGMIKSDWAHVDGEGVRVPLETRVLRAVVYLTYVPGPEEYREEDDDGIEEAHSAQDAEKNIARVLDPSDVAGGRLMNHGLMFPPSLVDVVDAEWMSVEESENYPPTPFASERAEERDDKFVRLRFTLRGGVASREHTRVKDGRTWTLCGIVYEAGRTLPPLGDGNDRCSDCARLERYARNREA